MNLAINGRMTYSSNNFTIDESAGNLVFLVQNKRVFYVSQDVLKDNLKSGNKVFNLIEVSDYFYEIETAKTFINEQLSLF